MTDDLANGDDLLDSMDEVVGPQGKRRRSAERRDAEDRRDGQERRQDGPADYCGPERRQSTDRRIHAERRLGGISSRRQQDRKVFEDRIEAGELTLEEVEFIRAIDQYKRKFTRPFPTWSEILLIIKELGYTKDSL
jgi:hypothetical protein